MTLSYSETAALSYSRRIGVNRFEESFRDNYSVV